MAASMISVAASGAAKVAAASAAASAMFDPGTISFEWAKALPTAVATFAIGLLAFWVANGQRKIAAGQRDIAAEQRNVAAAKLNFDLFERRYAIFLVVWRHASRPTDLIYPFGELTNEIPKARFLFGEEVGDYMAELFRNLIAIWSIEQATLANGQVMRQEHIAEHFELTQWCVREALGGCKQRFSDFLSFDTWRSGERTPASQLVA